MRYINDPHINPMEKYDGSNVVSGDNIKVNSHHHQSNANLFTFFIQFVEVVFEGWPHIVAFTVRDVEQREELLVSYGVEYPSSP